jgi:hypothetical protein
MGKIIDFPSKSQVKGRFDISVKETIKALGNAKEAALRDIDFLCELIERVNDVREKSDPNI